MRRRRFFAAGRSGTLALPKRKKEPGSTQLFGSQDVSKTDLRVQLLGDVDELISAIGVARSHLEAEAANPVLKRIQAILLAVGANVADPKSRHRVAVSAGDADLMEAATESLRQALPPLRNFIIPGGNKGATTLHFARSVCRRAERSALGLNVLEPLPIPLLDFLNRLSTYLFHLARWQTLRSGEGEDLWTEAEGLKPGDLDVGNP